MQKGSLLDFLWGGGIVRGGVQSTEPSKNPSPPQLASDFSNRCLQIQTGNQTTAILNSRININNRELGLITYKNHQKPNNYVIAIKSGLQYFNKIYDENDTTLYFKDKYGNIQKIEYQPIRFCV